jgi:hypothetical protein
VVDTILDSPFEILLVSTTILDIELCSDKVEVNARGSDKVEPNELEFDKVALEELDSDETLLSETYVETVD